VFICIRPRSDQFFHGFPQALDESEPVHPLSPPRSRERGAEGKCGAVLTQGLFVRAVLSRLFGSCAAVKKNLSSNQASAGLQCRARPVAKLLAVSVLAGMVVCCVGVSDAAAQASSPLTSQFRSAVSFYRRKQFARAHEVLAGLLRQLPDDFEINELMGLVCEAQHNRLGAETAFKQAAGVAPGSFAANHNLGEFYIREGKIAAAIPYLKNAQQLQPSYNNGYDLALAEIDTGRYVDAKQDILRLLSVRNTAELHSLLAAADEKSGRYVQAAGEYELAAKMDPSVENIFDWGNELLLHDALQPATQVFERGVELHPASTRLRIALGLALYSTWQYGAAFRSLTTAIDLNPKNPRPYLILGKMYDLAPVPSKTVTTVFARFAQLQPRSANALYYYALSLCEESLGRPRTLARQKAETLLKKAIQIDPALAEAHFQLGMLYAAKGEYARSIGEYRASIRLNPGRADAHYRLARSLTRIGDRAAAATEFRTFNRLHSLQNANNEKQRRSVIAFVWQTESGTAAAHR
jgi:tetratricopeptide (TPR) repeat protein